MEWKIVQETRIITLLEITSYGPVRKHMYIKDSTLILHVN